jgi:hypothetical protein
VAADLEAADSAAAGSTAVGSTLSGPGSVACLQHCCEVAEFDSQLGRPASRTLSSRPWPRALSPSFDLDAHLTCSCVNVQRTDIAMVAAGARQWCARDWIPRRRSCGEGTATGGHCATCLATARRISGTFRLCFGYSNLCRISSVCPIGCSGDRVN